MFHSMIVNDAPETKSVKSLDNMHDLLAGYPWLLNPEYQVLTEEKKITKLLKEWGAEDIDENDRTRYDFLALSNEARLVVIEIKRAVHPVNLEDLQRLERYKGKLSMGRSTPLHMILICEGSFDADVDKGTEDNWNKRADAEVLRWGVIRDKTIKYYDHYRAVLEGDVQNKDFLNKAVEVAQTRRVIESGTVHRDSKARQEGLGPQDVDYQSDEAQAAPVAREPRARRQMVKRATKRKPRLRK